MRRLWRQIIRGEQGQALPIVLALLVIGGLMIAPALNHISTSLNAGMIVEKNVKGVYAAEAGVEDALWKLIDAPPFSELYQLPEPVNQMQVVIEEPDYKGTYTLYRGELREFGEPPQKHYDWLDVDGEMELIGEETYKYTITVTWQEEAGSQIINLGEVGIRLPLGYSYVLGSAADPSFADNLSTLEPDDTGEQDQAGAYMLNWTSGMPAPYVSSPDFPNPEPERTQTFYVTGEGALEGDYTWVGTHGEMSIGQLGEVVGKLYRITATATNPEGGETMARVVADVTVKETETGKEIRIISWQINRE